MFLLIILFFSYSVLECLCFFFLLPPSILSTFTYIYVSPSSIFFFFLLVFTRLGERVLASGSVQLPRFTLLESGSLLISPSHISDAGTYTCMASNSRGIDEASADLVVWGERAGLDGQDRRRF